MANFTIKQGAHYHKSPPFSTLPWVGQQSMARAVTFSPECAYDSAPYNAADVNKLFGLSFGFGGVHHNSARFGWRWSNGAQCIELLAYVYKDGQRNWDEQMRFPVVAQISLGETAHCKIEKLTAAYLFSVKRTSVIFTSDELVAAPVSLPGFGLTHGLYFGGELTAPHTMAVKIDRL